MKKFTLFLALTCSIANAITIHTTISNLSIDGSRASSTTYGASEGQYRLVLFNVANPSTIISYGTLTGSGKVENTTALTIAGTYMSALFDNVSKYYVISTTEGGPILAGTAQALTQAQADVTNAYIEHLTLPTAVTVGELTFTMPPLDAWLFKYGLAKSALVGIPTNLVNLACAVNANPTNFSGIDLSIGTMSLNASSISGAFALRAKDAVGTPTAVTKLNDPTALVISTTDSLVTGFSPNPTATLSLETGSFEVDTTQDSQFLRLEFTPAKVW